MPESTALHYRAGGVPPGVLSLCKRDYALHKSLGLNRLANDPRTDHDSDRSDSLHTILNRPTDLLLKVNLNETYPRIMIRGWVDDKSVMMVQS
jgi:hypothetical protein